MASPRLSRVAVAAAAILVATAVSALAVPRLLGEGGMVLADRVVLDIYGGRSVSHQALEVLRDNRVAATRHIASGLAFRERALAEDMLAEKTGYFQPDGRVWLRESIADYRRSLTLAPMDPLPWMRLARLEWLFEGASARGAAAMEMSFRVGPHWPEVAVYRFELAVILLRAMNAPQRALVAQEARRIAAEDPAVLERILTRWDVRELLRNE